MTNCIFYSLIFILFVQVSTGSLRISQINRTFLSIYKGMLEASMITVDGNGEPIVPYYDKNILKEYVDGYLNENISKYTKKYEITYNFINKNNELICFSQCKKVKITLKAQINYFYNYEKSQSFSIVSRDEL